MSEEPEPTFSLEEGLAVQKRMREALGLPPEAFPLPAFVGMLSDEIEGMRAAGRTDEDIAAMVEDVTGKAIDPAAIAAHYATPERRRGGP